MVDICRWCHCWWRCRLFRCLCYPTTFTVTLVEPYRRWEFDMENSNMKGHWTGIFTVKGDETEIDFTEQVEAKKLLMKPFVKSYLKKQQIQFVADIMKNYS